MGAVVALAFGWSGSLADSYVLDAALQRAGLRLLGATPPEEGARQSELVLPWEGEELPVTCRSYEEDGWVSTTVSVDEELFEVAGTRHGRAELVQAFVRVGITLLRQLQLSYIFFDEEADAEYAPTAYRADTLFGITILANGVPGLEQALQRDDVLRIERFEGGSVLFRRLDPVPHHRPAN